MQRLAGTAIAALIESGRLRGSDIILEHSRGSLWGWLIRHATGNYWNHALMVCTVRDYLSRGYDTTILADPRMGGIRIDSMPRYLQRLDRYDFAITRLDEDWFQGDSGLCYRTAISDIALREATDRYESRYLLRLVRRTIRQIKLAHRFLWQKGRHPKPKKKHVPRIAKPLNVKAYSCGGFVQWAYYRGVSRIVNADHTDRSRLKEVILNPRLSGEASDVELLSTTPADLARSERLSWKYLVRNGEVWEVSSRQEADYILKQGKRPA